MRISRIITCIGLFALLWGLPYLLPLDPYAQHKEYTLHAPSLQFLLGTDMFGRDIFARILHAVSNSIAISILAVIGSAILGLLLGLVAGASPSLVRGTVEFIADTLIAFPVLILGLLLSTSFDGGAHIIIIAQIVAFTPLFIRLTVKELLFVSQHEFVAVATGLGIDRFRVLMKHGFPFLLPKLSVQMVSLVAIAIGIESGLSFLGFGIPLPEPSMGLLLYDSRKYMFAAPWYAVSSIVVLFGLLLCIAWTVQPSKQRIG